MARDKNNTTTIKVKAVLAPYEDPGEVYEGRDFTVSYRTKREGLPDQIIQIVVSRDGDGIEVYTQNGRLIIEPMASNHVRLVQSKRM